MGALFNVGAAGAIFPAQVDLDSPCTYFYSAFQCGHRPKPASPNVRDPVHCRRRATQGASVYAQSLPFVTGDTISHVLWTHALPVPGADQHQKLQSSAPFRLQEAAICCSRDTLANTRQYPADEADQEGSQSRSWQQAPTRSRALSPGFTTLRDGKPRQGVHWCSGRRRQKNTIFSANWPPRGIFQRPHKVGTPQCPH